MFVEPHVVKTMTRDRMRVSMRGKMSHMWMTKMSMVKTSKNTMRSRNMMRRTNMKILMIKSKKRRGRSTGPSIARYIKTNKEIVNKAKEKFKMAQQKYNQQK